MNRACELVKKASVSTRLTSEIQKIIDSSVEKKLFPSLAVGVIRLVKGDHEDDSVLEMGAAVAGSRVVGKPTPVTLDDKYHVGSCGKAMTALMLQNLIEKESSPSFSWNTTVGDKIPDAPEAWKDITLGSLISHQAGIDDMVVLNGASSTFTAQKAIDVLKMVKMQFLEGTHKVAAKMWEPYYQEQKLFEDLTREERIKSTRHARLKTLIQKESPTEKYKGSMRYSNMGISLAANLAEIHFEKSYEELLKENFVDPLELQSLSFGPPQGLGNSNEILQPWGHVNTSFFGVKEQPIPPQDDIIPDVITPAGDMHLSITDWTKSLGAHLVLARQDEKPFIYDKQVSIQNDAHYGGGWIIVESDQAKEKQVPNVSDVLLIKEGPNVLLTHDGSNSRWYSLCTINLKYGFAVALTANTSHLRTIVRIKELQELVATQIALK